MKNYKVGEDKKVQPCDDDSETITAISPTGVRSRRDSVARARKKYDSWAAKEKAVHAKIFHPNTSAFIPRWDGVVGMALLFTATGVCPELFVCLPLFTYVAICP